MTQIAVKLPDDLVSEVDDLVTMGIFATRSSAVRRALEALVAAQRARAVDQAYEKGYRDLPESREEISEATRLATQSINDEPWERWW